MKSDGVDGRIHKMQTVGLKSCYLLVLGPYTEWERSYNCCMSSLCCMSVSWHQTSGGGRLIRRKLAQADLFEESRLLKKSRGKKISHILH